MAADMDGAALTTQGADKLRGSWKVAAVKDPGSGYSRKAILQELTGVMGADMTFDEMVDIFGDLAVKSLGAAESAVLGSLGENAPDRRALAKCSGALAKCVNSHQDRSSARARGGVLTYDTETGPASTS